MLGVLWLFLCWFIDRHHLPSGGWQMAGCRMWRFNARVIVVWLLIAPSACAAGPHEQSVTSRQQISGKQTRALETRRPQGVRWRPLQIDAGNSNNELCEIIFLTSSLGI